jgi:hypothetical protein
VDRVLDALTPTQERPFLTLYLRALDDRSTSPTLDDTVSSDLADRIVTGRRGAPSVQNDRGLATQNPFQET